MPDEETVFTFTFKAETKTIAGELKKVSKEAAKFNLDIDRAFAGVINKTKTVEEGFKALALQITSQPYKQALKPLIEFANGITGSAAGSFTNLFGFAKGGALGGAGGQILSAPTAFPLGGANIGIAGEAGPEAIVPLARGANGELGIRASNNSPHPNINITINTPDIESFRRSEAEIGAGLQRVISRANRSL